MNADTVRSHRTRLFTIRRTSDCSARPLSLCVLRCSCRACGLVVCGRCSTMTASIPARAEWPQRVCDKCWVQLAGSAPVLSQTAEEQKSEDADPSSPSTPSTPPSPRSSDPSNLARRRPRVVHFGSTHEIPAATAVEAKDDLSSSSSFSPSPSSPPEPVYSEAAVYSSPSPLSSFAFPGGGEGPAVLSPTDLFNRLAALSSLLLLDIRPASSYRASHVPRSVSFPVSLDDVRTRTPLQALEERLPALERRQLRMRQRSHIVVIGDGEDGDVDELQRLGYVCSLLMQPVKHSSLAVLTPGYAIFHHLYPFLSCEYPPTAGTPASTSDASAASVSAPLPPHVHLPAFPSYPSEVLPSFLFIGSHTDAANLAHLRHLRVTHIVNVTEDIPCHFPQHFTYVHVPIADAPDSRLLALLPDLVSTLTALASAPASPTPRVLIHCHQGVSRSCAVTLALLVRLQHVTLHAAFRVPQAAAAAGDAQRRLLEAARAVGATRGGRSGRTEGGRRARRGRVRSSVGTATGRELSSSAWTSARCRRSTTTSCTGRQPCGRSMRRTKRRAQMDGARTGALTVLGTRRTQTAWCGQPTEPRPSPTMIPSSSSQRPSPLRRSSSTALGTWTKISTMMWCTRNKAQTSHPVASCWREMGCASSLLYTVLAAH